MKLKPILLETNNPASYPAILKQCSTGKLIHQLTSQKDKICHIYLIDPKAEIREDDWCYMLDLDDSSRENGIEIFQVISCGKEITAKNIDGSTFVTHKDFSAKIICSTDKSLKEHDDSVPFPKMRLAVPQLSEQSIKLLIDYYNEQGKIPDEVNIDFEKDNSISEWKGGFEGDRCQTCNKWFYGFSPKPCDCHHIKLNSQETVDIIIPEKRLYSREEVEKLCRCAHEYGGANCIGSDKHSFIHFKEKKLIN